MNDITTDVFEGDFPPASYGQTLEDVEATIAQVVERVFRDDDGILRSCVNGRTMKPMRAEDVKDRPQGLGTFAENSSIPRRVKTTWANYEDAGQASGTYLEALCAKACVTGDPRVREPARRTLDAIVTLWENAAATKHPNGGGGRGWLPKPYAGIHDVADMHECSADQYCEVTLGLHSYYLTMASEREKKKIEEIIISFAEWWYDLLAQRCLEACTQRENFYHVRRGCRVADLDKRESGDDFLDVFHCELHVHWLAGYWKSRTRSDAMLQSFSQQLNQAVES